MDFFTADWNLNHFNIIKYQNRPYKTTDEMNADLINKCNAKVKSGDRLFFLGGFLFGPLDEDKFVRTAAYFRKQITCDNIFLIYGNHDRRGRKKTNFRNLFSFVGDYLEVLTEDNISLILSYYPIEFPYWNRIKDGAWHLHGHTYKLNEKASEQKKLDVGVDVYKQKTPELGIWSLSDIKSTLEV